MEKNIELKDLNNFYLFRCSTLHQDFESQKTVIYKYFERNDIDKSNFSNAYEFASGRLKWEDRVIADVIYNAEFGATIYISELSRLGRNSNDLFTIVTKCTEKNITIIECKSGMQVENKTIGGKAILFALAIGAEIEVENLRFRAKAGIDNVRRKLELGEVHISRAGNVVTKLGNSKGYDNSHMIIPRLTKSFAKTQAWYGGSELISLIRTLLGTDLSDANIISICQEKFDKYAEQNKGDKNIYGTSTGVRLIKSTYYRYKKYIINHMD